MYNKNMKELENIIINKTARIEEIIAYLISKKYIFKDKNVLLATMEQITALIYIQ